MFQHLTSVVFWMARYYISYTIDAYIYLFLSLKTGVRIKLRERVICF
jgi:hypothetical protein